MGDFWIIFDTTVLQGADHQLESASLRILLEARRQAGYRIAIPETTIREALNRDTQETSKVVATLEKEARRVAGWFGLDRDKILPMNEVKAGLAKRPETYETALRETADMVLPLVDLDGKDAFERAMRRRKPFDAKGKGTQDYIMWRSILEFLRDHDRRAYFITDNTDDFYGADGRLHPDLVADLIAIGRHEGALTVVRSAAELVEGPLKASFAFLDEFKGHDFEKALGKESVAEARRLIGNMLDGKEDFDDLLSPDAVEGVGDEIVKVLRVHVGKIQSALQLAGSEMLVGVTFRVEAMADEPSEYTRKGWLYTRQLNEYRGTARFIVDTETKEPKFVFIDGLKFIESTEPDIHDVIAAQGPEAMDEEEPEMPEPEPDIPDPDEEP